MPKLFATPSREVYPPQKAERLADYMVRLEAAVMICRNNTAVHGSVAMASCKGASSSKLVSDFRAVNAKVEQAALPTPNLEALPALTHSVRWIWVCCK